MDKQYYTIKELSKIVGRTTQSIYQRLDKDLKIYLKEIDGKKVLDKEVLTVYDQEMNKDIEQDIDNSLLKTIEVLKEQLNIKDQQIEKLQDELSEQNSHIRNQSDELVTLVKQVNELQRNNQALLKGIQEKDKPKLIEDIESVPVEQSQEIEKKSFFKRFFRK